LGIGLLAHLLLCLFLDLLCLLLGLLCLLFGLLCLLFGLLMNPASSSSQLPSSESSPKHP
jgi:hypothetical protein